MKKALFAFGAVLLTSCGGGSDSTPGTGVSPTPVPILSGCTGNCVTAQSKLTIADVQVIIAQAVGEASARGVNGTIAVVDRVGNVLGLFRMTGARATVRITSNRGVSGGLDGVDIIPSELAAISKAVTGAFLSSEGNAFSTRTASQIVQEHFNPGESGAPAGPLFGVQFSQLICSDVIAAPTFERASDGSVGFTTQFGPQAAPLGLSADPGGFPLYKGGTVVGGIGVAADDTYGLDLNIADKDFNVDELVALAGTFNFAAPIERRGDRITADGKTFRFSDVEFSDLARTPSAAAFSALPGNLIAAPLFGAAQIREGTAFTDPASGIVADSTDFTGLDAFVLVDRNGQKRFAPKDSVDLPTNAQSLKASEVRTILQEGLKIANAARAQIRTPTNSQARVSLSVVDLNGNILGLVRTRDAPIFGTDVAVQKARSAMFFSAPFAATELTAATPATYANGQTSSIGAYVNQTRSFFADNAALTGQFAITPRAIGNIARPLFPDGVDGTANGPLSKPLAQWSPFSDGLQFDLINNQVLGVVQAYLQARTLFAQTNISTQEFISLGTAYQNLISAGCTRMPRLKNGIQIFPGAVPIYRANTLIGAIGISGDGIDQDDMIAFLGLHNAGIILGGTLGNAPKAIRADQLAPGNARLRYVQCPQAPFLNSDLQNVCEGK